MGEEPGESVSAALDSLRQGAHLPARVVAVRGRHRIHVQARALARCHVRERPQARPGDLASRGRELARRSERQRGRSVRRGDRRSLRAGGRPGRRRNGTAVRPGTSKVPTRTRPRSSITGGRSISPRRRRLSRANPAGDGGSSGTGAWRRPRCSRADDAIDAYEKMRAAAAASGDKVAEARAWNGRGFIEQRKGDYQGPLASAERAEELAAQAGTSPRLGSSASSPWCA